MTYAKDALERSRVVSVTIKQVLVVESRIGNGENTPIRPFIEIFDTDGTEFKIGDITNEKPL